jgi:multimeric flavodoxin WrbA
MREAIEPCRKRKKSERMNILAINGSPKGKYGNTDRILQPFLQGAAAAGADCETIYAKDLDVKECTGCFG